MCLFSSPEWRSRASARSQWWQDSVAFENEKQIIFFCVSSSSSPLLPNKLRKSVCFYKQTKEKNPNLPPTKEGLIIVHWISISLSSQAYSKGRCSLERLEHVSLGRAERSKNEMDFLLLFRRKLCFRCLVSVVRLSLGGTHLQIHWFVQINEQ